MCGWYLFHSLVACTKCREDQGRWTSYEESIFERIIEVLICSLHDLSCSHYSLN